MDAKGHVAAALVIDADVYQGSVGQAAVGDNDAAVIEGVHHGVENLDLCNSAQVALSFDGVTHLERLEDQDQHAAREIRKAALEREANGQASSTNNSNEGRRRDADHRRDRDQQHDLEYGAYQTTQELVECRVFRAQLFIENPDATIDQPKAEYQCDDGQDNLGGVGHDQRECLVPQLRGINVGSQKIFHSVTPCSVIVACCLKSDGTTAVQ